MTTQRNIYCWFGFRSLGKSQ